MKKKNRIQKLVVLASALATMGFGSSLYAATYSVNPSATSRVWENPATWFVDVDGDGVVDAADGDVAATVAPGANDVVKLNGQTVTINGTSSNYAVKSLDLSTANSILQPAAGENITLKVGGDITFGDAASKIQQNGTGKLNLNIISSATLTLADDANMTVNNLTITDASVTSAAAKTITVNGNLDVKGTSSLKIAEGTPGVAGIVFPEGNHTVTVDPTASLSVATLTNGIGTSTSTGSTLVTSSNMTIYKSLTNKNDATFTANDGTITINGALTNAGTFTANGGTVRFNNADAACWANTGTMTLNNVEFLGTTAYAPATTALVKGNFSKLGTGSVKPTTAADIQFTGATQKTILNAGAPGDLEFAGGIVVASGASVATSSSFNIKSLETKANASFKANNGDITFNADGAITAVTPNSIEFNNLSIGAVVTTSSDFKILGNLTTVATGDKLTASAPSTITFENVAERTITSAADDYITFANMKVAAGSKVKNAAATSSFTVKDGGIEVEGTGSLVVDPAATVTFDGTTNTIKNEGTLSFGLVNVKAGSVTTASDFTVTGTTGGTNEAFTNAGTFEATDGTVTFTGAAPAIVADADQTKTVFNGITADGANTTVLTVTTGNAISINGDLTVNGTSTFAGADETAIVHFTGTKDQTIGGTSTATPAVSFPTTTVDKASGKLLLEKDVTLVASGALNLKNGIVDMGTTTLTANVAPTKVAGTDFGAIDGDKGTYVVATAHTLNDNLFTVDGEPTLNNLTAVGVLTLDGDLTVNGNLDLQIAKNAIAGNTLTVKGNLTHTVATGTFDAATGKLVLTGTGATTGLSNAYFEGTDGCDVNLEIGRAETLGGDLTMATGKTLTINTGINYLDLGEKTLTTSNNAALGIERISGSIDATKATLVKFTDAAAFTLPGNLFKDNTVSNLTIAGEMTLGSDLTITSKLAGAFNIYTGDNILTFGPRVTSANLPAFTNTACIVGNLKQTVTNTATVFPIGGGTGAADYNPVTLNFQTSGTTQEVVVSAKATEPTVGRAGNPENALDLVYTIKPIGTDPNDALNATFVAGTDAGTGTAAGNIPAKWENDAWVDYRANLDATAAATANNAIVTNYAIANSTALAGDWALFDIGEAYTAGTNDAKVEAAITTAAKNIVITSISPNPVQANIPFNVTVQLQDQYGQLITTNTRVSVNLTQKLGAGTIGDATGEIAAGSSFTTLTAIATAAGANNQLQIDDDDATDAGYAASVGEAFNVIADAPTEQATITAIDPANTTAKITWAGTATNTLIVLKADEVLTEDEFPVNGTTYTADALYGAGSQIGDAVVVAKGASGTDVTIRSLSPNTTYYAYAFAFAGTTDGTENYILTAASGNPQPFTTLGSNDDDVAFGENNTRETSRAIGTNTPVKGTIKDATDVDWFNFSVSSANPNVRAQLSTLPANYNVEIYNSEGKRIRRGIRVGQGSEGPVINGLAAGTYTLKIYSQDGSSSAEPYTLKVGTKSSEIFSVTP